MPVSDTRFAGSIPELYDRCMVPMLFAPYAEDLAARARAFSPDRILETAAGTGVVTAALARAVPDAEIVATDLNQAMLDRIEPRAGLSTRQADAQALPFPDACFDLVVCQFGAMFFPDRVAAYREARRVLRPGGRLLFNVWSRVEDNPLAAVATGTLAVLFRENPPGFLRRMPHGYHEVNRVAADLMAAGFGRIEVEAVLKRCRPASALEAAIGFCQGSPLRAEIEAHGPGALDRATEAVALALSSIAGTGGIDAVMSAQVFSAAPAG